MKNELNLYESKWDSNLIPQFFFMKNNDNPIHFHSSVELIYVLNGEFETTINGTQMQVCKNQMVFVPCYSVHGYKTNSHVDTIVLIVPLSYIPYYKKIFENRSFNQYVFDGEYVAEIYQFLSYLCTYKNKNDSRIVKGYIELILATIFEKLIPIGNLCEQKNYKFIQNVLEYINENFKNDISISTLANEFGYSESRFSHIFNENIGYTFPTYIGLLRAIHVTELLSESDISITSAAMSAGFNSINTFYRYFKKCFGISPGKYVKNKEHIS
jgi:xylan 1,4-beta-xylosidase